MQNIKVDFDLFYYLEEDHLTWHCPQFALYGVAPYEVKGISLDEFAFKTFENKLDREIKRFPSTESFINSLIEQGHWYGGDLFGSQPKPLEFFLESQPVLAKLVSLSSTQASKYSHNIRLSA